MSWETIEQRLSPLYGTEAARLLRRELEALPTASQASASYSASCSGLSEKDASLIVYANSMVDADSKQSPLQVLGSFLRQYELHTTLPIVHILPFYPWDTDRGFSVEDYYEVHPEYGDWSDIEALTKSVRLMFDFVANHASISNPLVQQSLIARHLDRDDARYQRYAEYEDFVIAYEANDLPPKEEIAALSRPRAAPVLSPYVVFEKPEGGLAARLGDIAEGEFLLGVGYVWTTFSRAKNEDGTEGTRQVDLNFKNPKVFLETVKILLFYCEKGADLVRLDAIGYLWKKLGSSSLHEKETHQLLAVLHAAMQLLAPRVVSVAEVNEPQDKVLGYLGSAGAEESDLVYQFTHFPLAVHAIHTGVATHYRAWLKTLEPFEGKQFITVLGSHDGLGMKPVRGILPEEEIESFQQQLVNEFSGKPNFAKLPGGKEIIYEICGTPWELIVGKETTLTPEQQYRKYLLVSAMGLLPRGLPAFYINGVLGSLNYAPAEGLDENRTVNREVFSIQDLDSQLNDTNSRTSRVLSDLSALLKKRAEESAFSPDAPPLEVLECAAAAVLAVYVPALSTEHSLVSICNVSAEVQEVSFSGNERIAGFQNCRDILGEKDVNLSSLTLEPYQVMWLKRS